MKKLVLISLLFILVLTLGGCVNTEYTVSGEILGVTTGQVVIGDRISAITDGQYSVMVAGGEYSLKVLDAEGYQVYGEQISVNGDLTKNLDFTLTAEQMEELRVKTEQTLAAKANWKNLRATPQANDPKGNLVVVATVGAIGSYGDMLVTLDGTSSSSSWAGGHAGLVENSNTVIEAFGNKGDLNGVRRWPNDWAIRYSGVEGLRVYGATLTNYSNATAVGVSHVGKPYNYWFWNITTTSSFYCSQLCWRAWYNQGWDLNDGGAVWPVDLTQSPYTYVFYVQ